MNNPIISVITPTYNSAKDIESCILSVAQQSYPNKEHLIIDNLSSDKTLEIIERYAALYPHIRYMSEKDHGIYDAMNKGIKRSCGEWIYFLGSDDRFFDQDVLSDIVLSAEATDPDVMYGNVQWGNEGGTYDGEFSLKKLLEQNICHQAIFFRRELFYRHGEFDTRYPVLADWAFNMQWFGSSSVVHTYLNRTIAIYCAEGVSSQQSDTLFLNERERLMRQYFPEEFVDQFYVHRAEILREKEIEINQLHQTLREREMHIAELDQQLRKINNSLFRRITKPIRKLSSSLRKRLG
jgi:glycosyltransferase involved in cell wall biosynthesis